MNSEIKQIIAVCITIYIVSAMAISGCTYIITENNAQYYRNQNECIAKGGIWVPNSPNSTATCVSR